MMSARAKGSLLAVVIVLLLAAAFVVWVNEIGRKEWKAEGDAVLKAYEQSILYTASQVVPFNGEHPYMVVYGKDKLQKDMMVWVGEQGVHVEYAADGISKQDAAAKVISRDPANRVIRTLAGKWLDEYAWEVFYKKSDNGQTNYYYDYYRFSDGNYLDTYNLSHQ